MGHQTSALLRCLRAGAPLTALREKVWTLKIDEDGYRHPMACKEVSRRNTETVEMAFAEIIEAATPSDHSEVRGGYRRGVPNCHIADAIAGSERAYLRFLDSRVRVLLEMREWLAKGQVPFAVTSRARLIQDARLHRLPACPDGLSQVDQEWLDEFTAEADAELATELAKVPGMTRTEQLTSLMELLATCADGAGPYQGRGGRSRLPVGVVAREALAVTLSGNDLDDKDMTHRLTGRGVPAPHGLEAMRAAQKAAASYLDPTTDLRPAVRVVDPGVPHLVSFTLGKNLDIPKDGLAGFAVAAVWLAAEQLFIDHELGATVKTPTSGRIGSRGVAVVPAALAAAVHRASAVELDVRTQAAWSGGSQFDARDAGPWKGFDTATLATMVRLWAGATDGPLTQPENALTAAAAVHA